MMTRWDPFREMAALQRDINRLFDTGPRRRNGFGETRFPLMDISETEHAVKVRALVPGLTRDEVQITLHQNVLSISGTKKESPLPEGARPLRTERTGGAFERTLRLNKPVDADGIKAEMADGILTLTLPVLEEAKPKQIEVSAS